MSTENAIADLWGISHALAALWYRAASRPPKPESYKEWKRGDVLRLMRPDLDDLAAGYPPGLVARHADHDGRDVLWCVPLNGVMAKRAFTFRQLEFVSRPKGGAQ